MHPAALSTRGRLNQGNKLSGVACCYIALRFVVFTQFSAVDGVIFDIAAAAADIFLRRDLLLIFLPAQ